MESKYRADPNLIVEPKYYNNGVPVFEPSMEEFHDFYRFNKAINKYGMQSGIVKIVPPAEWINSLKGTYTTDNLENICIKNPIVQNINVTTGRKGVYSSQNVEKQRKYNIFQWKELSQKSNHTPPATKHKKTEAESEKMELRAKGRPPNFLATSRLLLGDFNIDVSGFSPERCEELENLYWKSLGYSEPMYGADMLGSVFKDQTKSWNVAHLPNLLDLMEEKLPGVNDAYLYAGLWKASFSWHLEDQDLYSINYLHFGAPKQWYSIPQAQAGKFFDLMKDIFSEHYKNCPEFLRHKTFIASPQFLRKNGITCNSIVHNQGEFIITYPYGYHSGFNYGFNLAESVNFALDDWLEIAKKAHKCECIKDSVGINHQQIYCKYKGIPYGIPMSLTPSMEIEMENSICDLTKSVPEMNRPGRKRQKIMKPITRQCELCPNVLSNKITLLHEFQLLDVVDDPGKKVHRVCALSQEPLLKIVLSKEGDIVSGLEKALKSHKRTCTFCHVPNSTIPQHLLQGASLACSMPKCRRNYHATCAFTAGFTFDDKLCKMHRAKSANYLDANSPQLYAKCSQLKPNSIVQFAARSSGKKHVGDLFCGLVFENSETEHSLAVWLYPSMTEYMEVHYDDVLMTDVPQIENSSFLSMKISETSKVKLQLPVLEMKLSPDVQESRKSSPTLTYTPELSSQINNLPVVPHYHDPQYGLAPVFVTPSSSFNFEMRPCRSGRDSNNLVFVNEYLDVQTRSLTTPENYQFVDANYSG